MTESTDNLPGVRPTCDVDELGLQRPVYERIFRPRTERCQRMRRTPIGAGFKYCQCALSTPIESVRQRSLGMHGISGMSLLTFPPCNPETGAANSEALQRPIFGSRQARRAKGWG